MGTVLAGGAFDALHPGHLAYLQAAATYGPVCVAVATDAYIQQTKGRPAFLSQSERMTLLLGLRGVSEVIAQDERGEAGALDDVRPLMYVKGSDWRGRLPEAVTDACYRWDITPTFVDTVRDSSSNRLAAYVTAIHEQGLGQLEALIASQKPATEPWQPVTDYSYEARKAIEGPHAQLIKDVLQPKSVLDVGCGPGHLVRMLIEAGVERVRGCDVTPQVGHSWFFQSDITADDWGHARYDLVISRECCEHLTVLGIRQAVRNLCTLAHRYVYLTTRFNPQPAHLFDVQTSDDLDPTHISMLPQTFLRSLFVLEGFRRRADLEDRMDWMKKGRVLVYERG